jgi:hypothetical protein
MRMEPIMNYLKRKLRDAGSARWELIAAACDVPKTLPRKIVCNERDKLGINKAQPLLDFFHAVDRGERELPEVMRPAGVQQEAA